MDKKTQRTTGIRQQPLLMLRSPDASPRQHGEFVEIFHQGQDIAASLQPTPLPDVRHRPEVFDETGRVFQAPLPSFMGRWWKADPGCRDSYELPELASPPSNKLPEVGAPPRKRAWPFAGNMSPADLPDLHRSTLSNSQAPQPPRLWQVPDPDEIRARLMASSNPQKLGPRTPDLPQSRHVLDELAMTRPLAPEDPVHLDPVAFVRAVQGLSLGSHQDTLRKLGARNSYDEMVEFAKSLKRHEGATLWNQAQKWRAARDPSERNPMASQLMTLLVLFTAYTPSLTELDEFIDSLPLTLSPPLAHLRKDCLDRRAALASRWHSAPRSALLDRLIERYGKA